MKSLLFALSGVALVACAEMSTAPAVEAPAGFSETIASTEHLPGFFDVYVDQDAGKIMARLPAPDEDGTSLRFIHAMRLTSGLGSNPIGLDRGWGNSGQLIRFRKIADKVVAEVENHTYRATADNPLEKRAVADSFARSFMWSTPILATDPDGGLLIDLSSLLTTDALGLARRLKEDGGENFSLAAALSMPETKTALAFPDNVELEAHLTFTSAGPGPQVRATAPYPNAVTLTVHHSFVRLPDDGYRPRMADPRVGTFVMEFYDYSAPLSGQVPQGYAMRHRLERQDPDDPTSPFVEPITFYVDSGAPAQIRDALIDGAEWWTDAFDAAGLEGAYQVKVLPEDAHPLDIRYNVIQWVHRQTRGWSYGGGIADPRTGEFIKGHVILGSQRVRQDRMIFEGLAGVEKTGSGSADDPVELALARIRQLSAHEVAHALGFGHNFAASINDRASVTDYPAPWVIHTDDGLDFSKTYDAGIGEWDKVTVKWLYGEFPEDTEAQDLDKVVADARAQGLLYVTDWDGRSVSTAHAQAAVWDNGSDPVAELRNVMRVRQYALDRFDQRVLADGRPLAAMRDTLVPIYLYHRYQVDAAAKSIGGVTYQYGKTGENAPSVVRAPAGVQQEAIATLVGTINPGVLTLSPALLAQLEPHPDMVGPQELLAGRTGPVFDYIAAAETAADITFAALLNPHRAERLVQQHALDSTLPNLEDVMTAIDRQIGTVASGESAEAQVHQAIRARYIAALVKLDEGTTSSAVGRDVRARLERVRTRLGGGDADRWLHAEISAYLARAAEPRALPTPGPKTPPGSPIGAYETCWHCETLNASVY